MSAIARIPQTEAPQPVTRLSDVALMQACSSPDSAEAWDEFVRRFNRFVCLAVVRAHSQCSGRRIGQLEPETVSDLVQDVYVKLFERSRSAFGSFRGGSDAAVYVYIGRVAISVAVDAQRRTLARKRGRDLLSLDAVVTGDEDEEHTIAMTLRTPGPSPEQNAVASILRSEVAQVLCGIVRGRNAARDLRIAEAYLLDGTPLSEIAESIAGLGAGALKSSVRRTGARLRSELSRRERVAAMSHPQS